MSMSFIPHSKSQDTFISARNCCVAALFGSRFTDSFPTLSSTVRTTVSHLFAETPSLRST